MHVLRVSNSAHFLKHAAPAWDKENNRRLFSDPHKTHKYSCVGRKWN